jgi:hypothetical protein
VIDPYSTEEMDVLLLLLLYLMCIHAIPDGCMVMIEL